MKVQTVDEVCNLPPGSFQQFIALKKLAIEENEKRTKDKNRTVHLSLAHLSPEEMLVLIS